MQKKCTLNKITPFIFMLLAFFSINISNAKAGISYEYPDNVVVSLLNSKNIKENEIILRIAAKESYSGCVDISELTYEMEIEYGIIEIVTDGYAVEDTTGKDCNTNYKVPVANIILSLDELEKNEIQLIKFSNGDYEDVYAMDRTDEYIELTPQGKVRYFFEAGWKKGVDQMKLYHRPENMVLLFVKNPPYRDIQKYMDQFAKEHGLKVEKSNYIYPSEKYGISEFLYKDIKNLYLPKLKKLPYLELGKITIYNEREGQYRNRPQKVDMKVYVKKP